MSSAQIPALLGDGNGVYRIRIVGNSGSGKSTLGTRLAQILDVPYVSLDRVFWKPGWVKSSNEELIRKIRECKDAAEGEGEAGRGNGGWIFDGNYDRRGGKILTDAATDIIWMDPPFWSYFPRLVLRTFRRLFGLQPPCAPGCPETFREAFFSKESIILWCITQHRVVKKRCTEMMKEIGVDVPGGGGKMRRIGGWGGELEGWVKDVERLVHSERR